MAAEDMLPVIPRVQCRFKSPCWTVRRDLILLDTGCTRFGAKFDGAAWCSHGSSQNSVVFLSPNSMYVDARKKARTCGSVSIGSWLQARELSVF
jgi:hypothetical protein